MNNAQQFERYFPLGIAKGKSFIGREKDKQWLQNNINDGIHTLLLAPRRYGKSSLVLHTLEKGDLPFIELDLQLCRTAKSFEKKLLRGIEQMITTTIKEKEKILQAAKAFFKKNNKQWKIGLKGFIEVTIEPEHYDDIADNILTALQFLETLLINAAKRAVIFMDEVQEIVQIEFSKEIQGTLRHFAQKTSHIVFIFSGSNRRMLRQMFNDNAMPLYQLCDAIVLEKIAEKYYHQYIKNIAKITWANRVPDEIINEIVKISERHPRRIYNLCLYLWRMNADRKKLPEIIDVQNAWKKLIAAEAKGIRYLLSQNNTSQLKVLVYLALGHISELTSKEAQQTTALSATAISKALVKLEEQDLIERHDNNTFHIIDPVVRDVLIFYESETLC